MSTRRSVVVVFVIVVVIVLSGCSGLSPSNPEGTHPDGYGESGIDDPERAADQHAAALTEYDNYTERMNLTSPKFDGFVETVVRIDDTENRSAAEMEINRSGEKFLGTEMYHDGNMSHTKSGVDGYGDTYTTDNESLSSFREELMNASAVDGWLANISFEAAGTVARGNETLYRYNATDVEDPEAFFYTTEFVTIDAIESVDSTLLVDGDGLIRSFDVTVTYVSGRETRNGTISYRVTDLGSTTVEKPGWIDDDDPFDEGSRSEGQKSQGP